MYRFARRSHVGLGVVLFMMGIGTGCHNSVGKSQPVQSVPDFELPKELTMTTHPPYTVAAPDILRIDANRLIPLPPYKIEPLDALYLFAPGAPAEDTPSIRTGRLTWVRSTEVRSG